MTESLIRGRTLSFSERPRELGDTAAFRYVEDGAIHVVDGRIAAVGDYSEMRVDAAVPVIDHRPHLLLPGFIDPHLHMPQMQVVGSYGAKLLDWLNQYVFVEEQRFAEEAHAARIAAAFFDELIRNGTTTAVAFCSVHEASAEAFFAEAARRDMLMIGGRVMMDRNAPEALRDTPQAGYDETTGLIARWHGRGRARYAITPRFAITSSPEQMEMAGALAVENPDCFVQTHLSENLDEVAYARELHPWARDYLDVYERYGLTGPRSLFGHAIHLTDREYAALAASGSVAVFCPTSNLFLGSGLFDWARAKTEGVRVAVATDIGGGTSYSMPRTMDEAYKVAHLQGARIDPFESFYQMTLGNARALGLEARIGTLAPGSDADIVVLDSRATPAMALRMETASSLAEELFVLQTMSDDRAVAEVYAAGRSAKSGLAARPAVGGLAAVAA